MSWGNSAWRMRVLHLPSLIFLTFLFIALSNAYDSVHIRSVYDQMVTSSTLRWIKGERGSRPNNTVLGSIKVGVKKPFHLPTDENEGNTATENHEAPKDVEREDVYVCRARHNGAWLPGRLGATSTACHVSLNGLVFAYDTYEVLQNEEAGAKLSWVHWNRFNVVPVGAVGGGESKTYYVARRAEMVPGDEKRSHYVVGKLDTSQGMGRISVAEKPTDKEETSGRAGKRAAQEVTDEKERHYTEGQVLVETEPQSYELSSIHFEQRRKKTRSQHLVLATGQLVNEGQEGDSDSEDGSSLVDTVLSYTSDYSVYWGQGKAMLKGLPTAVVGKGEDDKGVGPAKAGVETFKWGLPETGSKQETERVEARLLPGTAANVSLVANKTDVETPYTARLVAHFADGSKMSRLITGSRRLQELRDIRVVIEPAYFLSDGTLVPTTTTTTTTTPEPTTTTTTTEATTTSEDPPPPPPEPPQSNKIHSMLSDEQSVEKETWSGESRTEMKLEAHEAAGSATGPVAMSPLVMTLVAVFFAAIRRT